MFACVYIPDFPVQALVRNAPELRQRAIAILCGTPPLVRVAALNEKARALGMEIGMTKIEAGAFAEHKPEPIVTPPKANSRPRHAPMGYGHRGSAAPAKKKPAARIPAGAVLKLQSPEQEAAAQAALLDAVHAFSPRVEEIAPGMVIADMAGMERLFGPALKISSELSCRLGDLGLEAHIATAANIETAALGAYGIPGITVIPGGCEMERLGPLSIDVLCEVLPLLDPTQERERAREMLETLDRWGVRTLHALTTLPVVPLTERLGSAGLYWQRLACGEGWRSLQAMEPSTRFEETVELDCAVELLEPLAFVLARLLDQLCLRLASRSLAVQELRLRMQLEHRAGDETTHTLAEITGQQNLYEHTLRLPVPMQDSKVLLKLVQLELDANPPGAPVVKLTVAAEPAKPRTQQDGFFLPAAPEAEKLEITLARIQRVVGAGRAGKAVLLDTHRPDAFHMEQFRTETLTVMPGSTRRSGTVVPAETANSETQVAIRMFRPAIPVEVDLHEGCPKHLRLPHANPALGFESAEILWAAGPWHTSGDWWNTTENATNWEREEWDVALKKRDHNALYRIAREKETGRWIIAAEYD